MVRLGDWDDASTGPREPDPANTVQGARFGRSPEQPRDFTDQYGYDSTDWTGLPVLIRMRHLHTWARSSAAPNETALGPRKN